MDNEKQELIRQKQQEIINLKADLESVWSAIGDYTIAKTYEARLLGESDPYDTEAIIAERRVTREKISALEEEILELEGGTKPEPTPEEKKAQALNALDTGYDRAKQAIGSSFLDAVMSEDAELQAELKMELLSLNEDYDTQRREIEEG